MYRSLSRGNTGRKAAHALAVCAPISCKEGLLVEAYACEEMPASTNTHSATVSDPRSHAQSVVRTPGRVLMTTGARLRSRVRGKRARGVLQQRWMERSLHRLEPTTVHCGYQRTHLVSLLVSR